MATNTNLYHFLSTLNENTFVTYVKNTLLKLRQNIESLKYPQHYR